MSAPAHAQALYRRWRPQTFSDVIGQPHITRTLTNAVAGDRLAHAYLFTGPRGTGKTSVARILAKAANCTGDGEKPCNACSTCVSMTEGRCLDLIEIDAASNTGVDDVRDLRDKIVFSPNEATYKVYIIDEVHMLSTAAFNALLKTLEEPPPHALFVLATTEPHKIPDTISSRCQRHDFRRVATTDLTAKLRRICDAEGVHADQEALEVVARSATGSIRDGESLLDQLMSLGEPVTLQLVRDVLGTPTDEAVGGIVEAISSRDAATGVRRLHDAIDRGADVRQLQSQLLGYLRGLMLIQTGIDHELLHASSEQVEAMAAQADRIPPHTLLRIVRLFNDARLSADMTHPSLPLELALVESVIGLSEDALPASSPQEPPRSAAPSPPTPSPRTPSPRTRGAVDRSAASRDDSMIDLAAARAKRTGASGPKAPGASGAKPAEETGPKASEESGAGPAAATSPEASAPTATKPASAPTPSAGGSPLARVQTAWEAIVKAVAARDKNTASLLKDCRVTAADDRTVTLGFFYDFHCQRVSEPKRAALVTEAVSATLGSPYTIQCTVAQASPEDSAGRPRSLAEKAKDDPVVRHAIDELGGRVVGVTKDTDDHK